MRIISKFKDYYDSASGHGVDMTVVYTRVTEELEKTWSRSALDEATKTNALIDSVRVDNSPSQTFTPIVVGFCGKMYYGLMYYVDPKGKDPELPVYSRIPSLDGLRLEYAWKASDLSDEVLDKQRGYRHWKSRTIREWFTANPSGVDNLDWFLDNKIVCCYKVDKKLVINPKLQDIKFQRVFDSFSAYQEIAMFVSGVMCDVSKREPEPITDVMRAATKGFDQHSFRRGPTKR